MNRGILTRALGALLLAGTIYWWPRPRPPASPRATEVPTPGRNEIAPTVNTSHVSPTSYSPPPAAPPDTRDPEPPATPVLQPAQQLEALRLVFRNYGQRFRGNPVGNNAEITAALKGRNPNGVNFLVPEMGALNERGELVDRWRTPYFFHQLSGYEMEIHSAGPDRRMGTADDLIIR